jgi:hypothetical protein
MLGTLPSMVWWYWLLLGIGLVGLEIVRAREARGDSDFGGRP